MIINAAKKILDLHTWYLIVILRLVDEIVLERIDIHISGGEPHRSKRHCRRIQIGIEGILVRQIGHQFEYGPGIVATTVITQSIEVRQV